MKLLVTGGTGYIGSNSREDTWRFERNRLG